MRERMPDFTMPSDDEVERARALADDEARERDARGEALAVEHAHVPAPAARRASAPAGDARQPRGALARILAVARNPLVTFVAGAALVAAAFVAVPAIQRQADAGSMADLERVVAEYVAAVESGDFAQASSMVQPDADYAEAGLVDVAEPTSLATFDCAEPRVDDDRATVSCGVSLPTFSQGSPIRLELVRDGGWRLDRGLAVASPLWVSVARVEEVGGVEAPDGFTSNEDPVWLYPAEYELGIVAPAAMEVAGTALLVTGDGAMWFGGVTPSEPLAAAAEEAAIAYLDACAATPAAGCPDAEPLGAGERYAAQLDGATFFGDRQSVTLGVGVRLVGGSPATWRVQVTVTFADDLQSYELAASPEAGF